ncbi:hypothetical protein NDU88_004621 [Pleurodeles waltl]|uniref:Uncharacterized protein n=1 Tax=Pleurodeles waltl TaxID=8319 RepID=A0AAV7W9M2_PLEWA|nr:hypothetical protein NDU88_004621 [Pleurodeles waltl]
MGLTPGCCVAAGKTTSPRHFVAEETDSAPDTEDDPLRSDNRDGAPICSLTEKAFFMQEGGERRLDYMLSHSDTKGKTALAKRGASPLLQHRLKKSSQKNTPVVGNPS